MPLITTAPVLSVIPKTRKCDCLYSKDFHAVTPIAVKCYTHLKLTLSVHNYQFFNELHTI
jgi:hypothetical protein